MRRRLVFTRKALGMKTIKKHGKDCWPHPPEVKERLEKESKEKALKEQKETKIISLREFLRHFPFIPFGLIPTHRPHIFCVDGYRISVQASEMHFCNPRENFSMCEYNSVEVGCPSSKEGTVGFIEESEWENGSVVESVAGNIPAETVQELLDFHGGIDFEKTLENFVEQIRKNF